MTTASTPMSGVGIAIVAPSGYAPEQAAHERAVALLESWGCRVRSYYEHEARHQRFGATDAARVAQIHAAAQDPDTQVVLALRGGYGMSRLLHAVDFRMLANSGKLFVGHSDFTAFHMGLLAQTGAISFSGPMVCSDFSREEPSGFTLRHFQQCLTSPSHTIEFQPGQNPAVELEGMLWGGNLSMLVHLAGTPYFSEVDGGILFLEDVNEHPYRVERMLLQLLHTGVLSRQKAVVLGAFSNYQLAEYDNGYDFAAMLDYFRSRCGIPVLTGLPFGHIRDKVTLPVGCQARLVSDGSHASVTMCGYPFIAPRAPAA
ncbi:muramoyltetrapeptide carboxypeptidase [Noviherbaspirillum massiliense]|uniref:muramoyltetrapeptide carboxypeptidase n=1 Tax=Noviherbaspirillum massiliense TaxID=1465823 RepID=UPI0002F4660B|nr:muramoyltetrapeptide carboxypeptidase [Noviherbaspirillum massiliense]